MANKQLTVAELMARAAKDNPSSGQAEEPRRRRRRSLEEGGVSVAELTGSLKAVDARPAEVKHSSQPIDGTPEPAADEKPVTFTKLTPAQPSQRAEQAEEAKEPEADVVKRGGAVDPAELPVDSFPRIKPSDVRKAETVDDTDTMPVVEDEQDVPTELVATQEHDFRGGDFDEPAAPAAPAAGEATELEPIYEDAADYEGEVDTSVNPIMLVLLVFAGLAVGVLVFLGFQYLWGAMNTVLVAVLALVATAGIVLGVRSMKTGRDALTLTLAALAGIAMTFGPALITGF